MYRFRAISESELRSYQEFLFKVCIQLLVHCFFENL